MLYCNDCEREVERISLINTVDLETGTSRYVQVCDKCGSTDIREAHPCSRCGGFNKRRDSFICDACKKELKMELDAFLMKYTEEEKEAMLEEV